MWWPAPRPGAAIAHIHVRDKDGVNCMDTAVFEETCAKTREALARENLDIVLNLTTSGSKFSDDLRLAQLHSCLPEMCSYDPGTLNWGYKSVFLNTPVFLERLGREAQELEIKPEVEIFDGGMMGAVDYYVKNGFLKAPVHYQFVLGVRPACRATSAACPICCPGCSRGPPGPLRPSAKPTCP